MRFSAVIFKNLLHRKTRSALTISGLTMAVLATTALLSIVWHYVESSASYYAARGVDIVVVRAGVTDRLTSSLRGELATRLAKIPGVAEIDGSLTEKVSLGEGSLYGIPLRGLDPHGFTLAQFTISEGRTLQAGDRGRVLLGVSIAESLHKRVGQTVQIEGTPFEVAGIFTTADPIETNSVVALQSDVQKLMDRPGQISELQIRVANSLHSDEAVRELCHKIEQERDEQDQPLGLKALPARQFVSTAAETKLAKAMAWGTSAIVIVLSLLGIMNTMLMSVLERTREIGILRAVGWTKTRVVRMILGESVLLSAIGAVLGVAGAWLVVLGLSRWTLTKALVAPGLSLAAVGCGLGVALLAGVAGALYPAVHGAGVPATEALRYE